jgi:hypothetical protein
VVGHGPPTTASGCRGGDLIKAIAVLVARYRMGRMSNVVVAIGSTIGMVDADLKDLAVATIAKLWPFPEGPGLCSKGLGGSESVATVSYRVVCGVIGKRAIRRFGVRAPGRSTLEICTSA